MLLFASAIMRTCEQMSRNCLVSQSAPIGRRHGVWSQIILTVTTTLLLLTLPTLRAELLRLSVNYCWELRFFVSILFVGHARSRRGLDAFISTVASSQVVHKDGRS